MIPIHIHIGTITGQNLTEVIFQSKDKRLILDIIIGDMVVIILIYIISHILIDHNSQMKNLLTNNSNIVSIFNQRLIIVFIINGDLYHPIRIYLWDDSLTNGLTATKR